MKIQMFLAMTVVGAFLGATSTGFVSPEETFIVSPEVAQFLSSSGDTEETMLVSLQVRDLFFIDTETAVHEATIVGGESFSTVNGEYVTQNEIDQLIEEEFLDLQRKREEVTSWREYASFEFSRRFPLSPDRYLIPDAVAPTMIHVALTKAQIREIVKNSQDIFIGVEKYSKPENMMASAMLATSVDPYVLDYTSRQGSGVGVYQSEDCCPQVGYFENYYRITGNCPSWTFQKHAQQVASIIREASPLSFLYCRSYDIPNGCILPQGADLNGYNGNPPIHVINFSCGTCRDSSAYDGPSRDADNLVYSNQIAFFAGAGNDAEYPAGQDYVRSPAEGLNVIAVGAYNDVNNQLASTSSWRNSVVNNEKPDITAPGVDIDAGGYGNASGTSFATPHATAIAADFMGYYTWLKFKPHQMNALVIATSTDIISGDWWKVGVGGIDFRSGFFDGYTQSWEGANNSWSTFDNNDPYPGDGVLDKTFYINASYSKVRVAIYWLNRGDYIYAHQNDAYVIGMDLDLAVYDPNGNLVGSSLSYENPWEVVTFDPTVSGTYHAKIWRVYNRDANCNIRLAIWVNMDN